MIAERKARNPARVTCHAACGWRYQAKRSTKPENGLRYARRVAIEHTERTGHKTIVTNDKWATFTRVEA